MQRAGRIGAALSGVVGILTLIGWYAGVHALTTLPPGSTSMKPNTALGVVMLAIAVLSLDRSALGRNALCRNSLARNSLGRNWLGRGWLDPDWLTRLIGAATAAIGVTTLAEHLRGTPTGIDRVLPGIHAGTQAARMAPATAASLALLGVAAIAGTLGRRKLMRGLALASFAVALVALLGYAYGVSRLYTVGGDVKVAPDTALTLAVLSVAILLIDPNAGLVGLLRDEGSAGRLLRTALPAVLIGPILLGWLRLWAEHQGWFDPATGVAVLVLTMTVFGCALSWRVALTLRSLDRQRDAAALAMAETTHTLEARVAERTRQLAERNSFTDALLETAEVGIISCNADGGSWVRNRAGRIMLGLDTEASQGFGPDQAAPSIDVLDANGAPLAVEDYPLLRALRGEDVGEVELRLGPSGGPHREVITRNSQIIGPDGAVIGAVSAITDISAERAASRAFEVQRAQLIEAQRIGQLGSFEYHFRTGAWTFSDQMAVLWGLKPGGFDPQLTQGLIVEDDREFAWSSWSTACEAGGRHDYEYRIRRANDGAERLLRSTVEIDLDVHGQPVRARGTHLDITDLAAAEKAARHATAFFDAVLAATPDYTFVVDVKTGAVIYGSRDKDILGITTAQVEALGAEALRALVHPDDQERVLAMNAAASDMVDGAVLQLRYRAKHADGDWRWVSRRITPFRRDASGAVVEVLGVLRDVSDVIAAEARLTHLALHDSLTGLPNRALLIDRLNAAIARSARDGREVAVLFCDLDGFKLVNDTSGHAAGDAVLQETARRMTKALRDADTVARVGGDEFVIIVEPWNRNRLMQTDSAAMTAADDRAVSVRVAERVREAVRAPITVNGVEHKVTVSIGIAYVGLGADTGSLSMTADEVLQDADAAMYLAKGHGKDRIEIFERGLLHQHPLAIRA